MIIFKLKCSWFTILCFGYIAKLFNYIYFIQTIFHYWLLQGIKVVPCVIQ